MLAALAVRPVRRTLASVDVSQAVVNPFRGTIQVVVGTDDEGTDLEVEHTLAPWPVDETCAQIAEGALSGMGWKVTRTRAIPQEADREFILDVAPAGGRPDPA